MTITLARILMTLASCCLGDARREWALAMQGEFEAAADAGKPLAFAAGCVLAACREMPRHDEGRFVLSRYGLALCLLIPVAGLQLLCAVGYAFPRGSRLYDAPTLSSAQALYVTHAYLGAVPLLLSLWLLLGVLHLGLAWSLLECDWQRIVRIGSLIAAGSATLLVFTAVLGVDDARPALQAGVLAIELLAISLSARRHARLSFGPSLERVA